MNNLFADNNFFQDLLENLHDGVYYVNNDRVITYWNKSAEKITGYSRDEVVNKRCSDNILRHIDSEGKELCIMGCPLLDTITDGAIRDSDVFLHHKKGHRVPVSVRVSPIYDKSGNITGAVEIFSDISRRNEVMEELKKLKKEVYIDQLTSVGNRKFADMQLESNFHAYSTHKVSFGIIFLDIDNFKSFNDTYGHDIGDEVLILVSKTINNILRSMDSVCRWGGEEFVVIVSNTNLDTLTRIAQRIRLFIEKSWLHHNNEVLKVTASLGAALIKDGQSIDELIKEADHLMYQSKKNGKNRVTVGN